MTKQRLCTLLTLTYHVLFLGGTTTLVGGYIEEIDKLRVEIEHQGTRAEKVVSDMNNSVKDVEKAFKDVKKACKRIL